MIMHGYGTELPLAAERSQVTNQKTRNLVAMETEWCPGISIGQFRQTKHAIVFSFGNAQSAIYITLMH